LQNDVIVIGAGASGLAAARELERANFAVAVIEARDRIGGRILTVRDTSWPIPVELGAEFVHGEPEESFAIIRAAALAIDQLPDKHYRLRKGRLSKINGYWVLFDEASKEIKQMARRHANRDFSFMEYLDRTTLSSVKRQNLLNFVEGYHAADPKTISARSLVAADEENSSGGRQFRIVSGYDRLIGWLRAGLYPLSEVRLNTVARKLYWKRGEVTVHATNRLGAALKPLRARSALITLPLATLKSKALQFFPELPSKERALEGLNVGHVFKVVLRFRRSFWDDDEFLRERLGHGSNDDLHFIHAQELDIPVWWTARPARVPILTGWAGGPKAEQLLNIDTRKRMERCVSSLATALSVPRTRVDSLLEGWRTHDWRADPFSGGAYTFVGVDGLTAQQELGRPVRGTLFFAGEATSLEQMGTVAGAIGSGKKAAHQIIQSLK
jgi:monoamine oxidase